MKERLEYVDAAKGLAILLVILGHCEVPIPYFTRAVYSFHIPLFFMVSGMFLSPGSLREVVAKYARRLLVPCVVTTCLALCVIVIGGVFVTSKTIANILPDFLLRVCYGSGGSVAKHLSDMPIVGPLWFLMGMFVALLIWNAIALRFDGWARFAWFALLAMIGVYSGLWIQLPFCLQNGCLAAAYLELGSVVRRNAVVEHLSDCGFTVFAPLMLLWLARIFFGEWYCLSLLQLGGAFDVIMSVVAPILVLAVLLKVHARGGWIGRSTLSILCAHGFFQLCKYSFIGGGGGAMFVGNKYYCAALTIAVEMTVALCGAVLLQRLPILRKVFGGR